jgi:hypothetical protein
MKHSVVVVTALAIVSAFSVQAAEITITSLPFTISAPGKYVLQSNLSYPGSNNSTAAAISINNGAAGPVILDMKGFTITGLSSNHNSIGISIGPDPGQSPITIRNGSLVSFQYGVLTFSFQQEGLRNITVNNMIFNLDPATPGAYEEVGVMFSAVQDSTVSNCSFSNGLYGIEDFGSPGGNVYSNDYFAISINALLVGPFNSSFFHGARLPIRLNRCTFAPTQ